MELKLRADRHQRVVADPRLRAREATIDRMCVSFGYDRENAEKIFEIMQVRQVEFLFGSVAGAFAAWKVLPIQQDLSRHHALFRKTWMRFPLQLSAFGIAYYCAVQLPSRFFRKFFVWNNDGINADIYKGENDLVGRFRLHENQEYVSSEDDILNYLSMYAKDPLTKPQLVE